MPRQTQKRREPLTPLISKINSLDETARIGYAEKCGTSIGNLRQIAYGFGGCSPSLAKSIVKNCDCGIKIEQIIPELSA